MAVPAEQGLFVVRFSSDLLQLHRDYCSGFSKLMLTANVQRSPSRRGPGSTSSVALSGIELI